MKEKIIGVIGNVFVFGVIYLIGVNEGKRKERKKTLAMISDIENEVNNAYNKLVKNLSNSEERSDESLIN